MLLIKFYLHDKIMNEIANGSQNLPLEGKLSLTAIFRSTDLPAGHL